MMIFLSLFGMFGCGPKSKVEQAEKKILETLHEKYGKEFELKTIGGGWGTMNNNTLKAVVKPKDDPTINVRVEITKDMKNVYDNYLNEMVARAAEIPIQKMSNGIWGESIVEVSNDTRMTYPEHADIDMSYEQFLELYPMNKQLVTVYLNIDQYIDEQGEIDQETEIERYRKFAQSLIENNYMRSSVYIWYITPEAWSAYDEARESIDTTYNYYKNVEETQGVLNLVTGINYKLDDQGEILTTKEEFKQKFENWKEERMKRVSKGDENG